MKGQHMVDPIDQVQLPSANFLQLMELPEPNQIELSHKRIQLNPNLNLNEIIEQNPYPLGSYQICPICYLNRVGSVMAYFCCWQHRYCKSCIVNVMQIALKEFQIIRCPDQSCSVELSEQSPYYKQLKEDQKKKIAKIRKNRDTLINPQVKLCRKEDCDGLLIIQPEIVKCDLCQTKHCRKCLQFNHTGRCDTGMASALKRKMRFKSCPNCKMIVQRNAGCNHITCLCTFEFCYVCGQAIGAGHQCMTKYSKHFFTRMRVQVDAQNSTFNSWISCSKILQFLQPDLDSSKIMRYAKILMMVVFLYPLINILSIGITLTCCALWLLITCFVSILYVILVPIFEIKNLSMSLSMYFSKKKIPQCLIRILMIPLYPINLVLAVMSLHLIWDCTQFFSQFGKMFSIFFFFATFPCFLFEDAEQDE